MRILSGKPAVADPPQHNVHRDCASGFFPGSRDNRKSAYANDLKTGLYRIREKASVEQWLADNGEDDGTMGAPVYHQCSNPGTA